MSRTKAVAKARESMKDKGGKAPVKKKQASKQQSTEKSTEKSSPAKKSKKPDTDAAADAAAAAAAEADLMDRDEDSDQESEEEIDPKEGDHVPVAQAAVARAAATELAAAREKIAALEKQLAGGEVLSVQFHFIFYAFVVIVLILGGRTGHTCLCRKAQEEIHWYGTDPASDPASWK